MTWAQGAQRALGVISALLESRGCSKTNLSQPVGLKLKSCGSSRPLGRRVFGWRNSSKKAWEQASNGENREAGVYSSKREHKVMASGGVRGLNTCNKTTSTRVLHSFTIMDTRSDSGLRLWATEKCALSPFHTRIMCDFSLRTCAYDRLKFHVRSDQVCKYAFVVQHSKIVKISKNND